MCDLTNLYCVKASPTTADRCHNHLCQQKYYACQFQDATSFRILHSSGIFAETALYLVIIIINRRFCTHQLAKRVVPHSAESKMMHHLVFWREQDNKKQIYFVCFCVTSLILEDKLKRKRQGLSDVHKMFRMLSLFDLFFQNIHKELN